MIALFGIIYILLPMLATPLIIIGLCLDKKRYKQYIIALVLNLAIIGYYFVPLVSDDLYRHFVSIDILRSSDFLMILSSYSTDPLILKNLWFYLISLTNNNSLLPFTAIIITYYIVLRDIFDFSKKEQISHGLTVSFVIIILTFWQIIWVMSGIRFSVTIALFFHGLFREFVLDKKDTKTYLYYLAPCFIHYSAFILILIRLLLIIKNKFNLLIITLLLSYGLFLEVIISVFSGIGISYIEGVALKAKLYLSYTNDSFYMITTNWMKISYAVVLVISYILLKRQNKLLFEKYKGLFEYGFLISLLCLGGASLFIIPDRFGFFVLCILPLFLMPLINFSKNKLLKQGYAVFFLPIILVGLYLQYVPLKSTNYSITYFELLTRNIVDLLIK